MTKQEINQDYLRREFPRCCLMDNPLTIKMFNELLQTYEQDVLFCRLRAVEFLLSVTDFMSCELTVKSIDFYLKLYVDGELEL